MNTNMILHDMKYYTKVYYYLMITVLLKGSLYAQIPQHSQYMMNPYLINPAVAGIEDYTDLKTGYRNQWVNVDGSPTTYYLTAHTAIGKVDRTSSGATPYMSKSIRRSPELSRRYKGTARVPAHHGIGFSIVSDQVGATSELNFLLSYALHTPLSGKFKLAFGAALGASQYKFDLSNLTVKVNPDPTLANASRLVAWQPTFNVGTYLYSRNFYIGISANRMLFDSYNYKEQTGTSGYSWTGKVFPHYFLTTGFRIDIGDNWAIAPSALIKKVNQAPLAIDGNIKAIYKDRLWFGGSYRHKDAVVGLLGVNVNSMLNIGYSYDFTTSDLAVSSRGSHEIVVGLMIGNRHKILCPQNLW